MTINDYLQSSDHTTTFASILEQAKQINKANPSILRREDQHIESCQSNAFAKPLVWLPIVIKDNMLLEETISSCGSKMLEHYRAPYTATVVRRLEDAGAIVIGKATMDEFAQGTTGENSPFPIPHNPYGIDRVAGGSSSGSAVAVASGMVPVALWSDTGWSVRLPASFCNIVGIKPTYGALSRYGVQAMAASFNQVGLFSQTVADAKQVFDIMTGPDPLDATTSHQPFSRTKKTIQWLRIGLPKQYFWEWLNPQIKEAIMKIVDLLVIQGAVVVELDIPLITEGIAVYYTLVPAEVSTDMARFDGLKYGLQHDTTDALSHNDYLATIRAEGFGDEVMRRILLWAHILSASEYEWLYLQAMKMRTIVTQQFKDHFAHDVDIILWPVSPTLPWKLGAKNDDPLALYLMDMYTVIANITGLPAFSLPIWFGKEWDEQLPIWLQIMWDHWSEYELFDIAQQIESLV